MLMPSRPVRSLGTLYRMLLPDQTTYSTLSFRSYRACPIEV